MSPSDEHEMVVSLFKKCPDLLRTALSLLGSPLPSGKLRPFPADLSTKSTEVRADNVITLVDESEHTVRAFVIETQRGVDYEKRFAWPLYIAKARADLECELVSLVAITFSQEVFMWASKPINFGEDLVRVKVIGPGNVPLITDTEQARKSPEAALLSAAVHILRANDRDKKAQEPDLAQSHARQSAQAVRAAGVALAALSLPDAESHFRILLANLSSLALKEFTAMAVDYSSVDELFARVEARGEARGEAQGEVRGVAELALKILAARFGELPPALVSELRTAAKDSVEAVALAALHAASLEEALAPLRKPA
jgi:hypothetical protein